MHTWSDSQPQQPTDPQSIACALYDARATGRAGSLGDLLSNRALRLPVATLYLLTSLQTFLAPMDYGIYHDKTPDGLDRVVIGKLLLIVLCTLAGAWGIVSFARVRQMLTSVPGLLFAALMGLMLLGGSSGMAVESIPMSLINYCFFTFVVTAVHLLGFRVFAQAMMTGIAVSAIMATFLYYLVPDVGVFAEAISMTERVDRLGGIGHPNSVARSMVLGCLLVLFLYRAKQLPLWIFIVLIGLFGWDALLAKSRTAIAAAMASACVLYADKWMTRFGIVLAMLVLAIGIGGGFYLFATGGEDRWGDKLLNTISKSGDRSEILTGTGRTIIWNKSLELIAERPLVGYGLNTATTLLREYGQSTHNAVLHAALSGGVLAGLIMFGFWIQLLWNALDSPNLGIRSLSTYLFLSCITEDTVLEIFPGPATMIWFVCIAAPFMARRPDVISDDVSEVPDVPDHSLANVPR